MYFHWFILILHSKSSSSPDIQTRSTQIPSILCNTKSISLKILCTYKPLSYCAKSFQAKRIWLLLKAIHLSVDSPSLLTSSVTPSAWESEFKAKIHRFASQNKKIMSMMCLILNLRYCFRCLSCQVFVREHFPKC